MARRNTWVLFTSGCDGIAWWGAIDVTAEATGDRVVEDVGAEDAGNETDEEDRRTGYYIAGHDWPAIGNSISLTDMYKALNQIDDDAVGAALQDVGQRLKAARRE